jgi:hypothetical protein
MTIFAAAISFRKVRGRAMRLAKGVNPFTRWDCENAS